MCEPLLHVVFTYGESDLFDVLRTLQGRSVTKELTIMLQFLYLQIGLITLFISIL